MMFGIVCRLTRAGVEAAIPKRLLTAGSPYVTIAYLERCHAVLAGEPATFGYDPEASYTLVAQTWDRAGERFRSIAFGRDTFGQEMVKLIPDPYFINSNGYKPLRNHADSKAAIPWSARDTRVVWRGSVTGSSPDKSPAHIPRVRLALACKEIAGTDVAIFSVHPTMKVHYAIEDIERLVKQAGAWGERWSMPEFGKYKFAIDMDGHANAWGLLEKLILGCCVLKVASPYEQWYYHQLQPWKHFIPISADFGDLAEKISWCRENQGECEWIAHNGAVLARALTMESVTRRSCFGIVATASLDRPSRANPDSFGC